MNRDLYCNTAAYQVYLDIRSWFMNNVYYKLVSPKEVISKVFLRRFGRPMNWENPRDLNEKLNWLKLNSDTTKWTELSDKYLVREYIENKGLGDILVKLYGKWDNAKSIEWDKLPKSFVLKTNHGSGDVFVIKDKSTVNKKHITKELNKYLRKPFGLEFGEHHYLDIKPCIIAEEYLEQTGESYTTSLVDYKVWCFDGEPAYIWACYSRSKEGVYVEVHDLDWNYLREKSVFTHHYLDGKGIVPKPKKLEEMIETAKRLSEGFPVVRVDLYEVNGNLYFGEMTFTSNGGFNDFYTQEFLNELGDKINLNKTSK